MRRSSNAVAGVLAIAGLLVTSAAIAGSPPTSVINDKPVSNTPAPPFSIVRCGPGADLNVSGVVDTPDTTSAITEVRATATGSSARQCSQLTPGAPPAHSARFTPTAPGSVIAVTNLGDGSETGWEITEAEFNAKDVKRFNAMTNQAASPLKVPLTVSAFASVTWEYRLTCDESVFPVITDVINAASTSFRTMTGSLSKVKAEREGGVDSDSKTFTVVASCEYLFAADSKLTTRGTGVMDIQAKKLRKLRRAAAPGSPAAGAAWEAPLTGGQQASAAVIAEVLGSTHAFVCQ